MFTISSSDLLIIAEKIRAKTLLYEDSDFDSTLRGATLLIADAITHYVVTETQRLEGLER